MCYLHTCIRSQLCIFLSVSLGNRTLAAVSILVSNHNMTFYFV